MVCTFAFLANIQSPIKMQKSYQANAQETHFAALDTVFSLTPREEERMHKIGIVKMRADLSSVSTVANSAELYIQFENLALEYIIIIFLSLLS